MQFRWWHLTSHLPLSLYKCCIVTTLLSLFSFLQPAFPFFTVFLPLPYFPRPSHKSLLPLFALFFPLFFPNPLFPIVWINLKLLNDEHTTLFACLMWEREWVLENLFCTYMFPLLLPTIIHRLSLEFISIWTVISSGELERDGWSRERRRPNERERQRHRQTER